MIRLFLMLAAALAASLIPCAPALADGRACRMTGCEKPETALTRPPSCCCATSGAPAVAGAPITVTAPPASGMHAAIAAGGGMPQAHPLIARQVDIEPPAHVPLFLLNATFLI